MSVVFLIVVVIPNRIILGLLVLIVRAITTSVIALVTSLVVPCDKDKAIIFGAEMRLPTSIRLLNLSLGYVLRTHINIRVICLININIHFLLQKAGNKVRLLTRIRSVISVILIIILMDIATRVTKLTMSPLVKSTQHLLGL